MHAMLDYPLGVVLILAPWIFGFSDVGGAAVALPIIVGALAIAQSLITDWELSIANLLPLPAHLMVDVVAGVVLAVSPFVFGFSDEGANAWVPHVVVGIGLVAAGLLTRRTRESVRPAGAARSRPAHR
jgi:SPW repeat